MLAARVFFLASVFNVRTSSDFHARRLEFLAISLPLDWKNTPCFCSLMPLERKHLNMAGSRLWEKRLRNEWVHRRMKALFPECSPLRLFSLQLLVVMVGALQKCGEVWITGIPGG
jgi:hypothetical protein